ncbi:MAG: hypothetical protein AAGD96_18050 [Chloroflexota bacterium]
MLTDCALAELRSAVVTVFTHAIEDCALAKLRSAVDSPVTGGFRLLSVSATDTQNKLKT